MLEKSHKDIACFKANASSPSPSFYILESKDSPTRKTIEGSWDQVVQLIGMAHTLTHQQGIARVQTDIRIETRY
jgi:hypothetical protein